MEKVTASRFRPEGMSDEDAFAQSPVKVAYDVLGPSFLKMPKAARSHIMELVMSGDLTADEIRSSEEYALPYNPIFGEPGDGDFGEFMQGHADGIDRRSYGLLADPLQMSEEEFYKRMFGYDYETQQEMMGGQPLMPTDNLPRNPRPAFGVMPGEFAEILRRKNI
tara:strand:- start:149 stop:643 length:495 start_codon:yes stop_codon:yes gene_type:complete